ncbi:MAG: hypothetical protein AABY22_10695, partial [Nanoarchaeota archaeon]
KKIPIFVTKGKNKGKRVGFVHFERNKEPYLFIQKSFRGSQMMRNPVHIGELPVSVTILDELKKLGVKNIIFMIIGFDDAGSFYIVVPLSDYDNAPKEEWDDPQVYVWLRDYPRIYPEQGSLGKFVM